METRLDDLDLLAIQIDGIHMDEDMLLVAAIGVDANGDKHPLGLVEGATENATTVQALIDNLVERELDPTVRRLFIVDGAKALSKAIRRTFGRDAAIQRFGGADAAAGTIPARCQQIVSPFAVSAKAPSERKSSWPPRQESGSIASR